MNLSDISNFFAKLQQAQIALRFAEIAHRLTYKNRYKRMEQAYDRYNKCMNKKPKAQIETEIGLCRKFWGCYPLHYYRYNLYRDDIQLSERELINYIPEFFFYYLFLPYFGSKRYEILLADKSITEKIFSCLSISQPTTLCVLLNKQLYTSGVEKIDFESVEQKIRKKNFEKIFVKPLFGTGGHGIYIFTKNKIGIYQTKDAEIFNEKFLKRIGINEDYIIQPGVVQDQVLSGIYSHSLNTFRIATENKNGTVRVLCATLRIGRDGRQVDNSAQDGLIVGIDLKTGKMTDHASSEKGEFFLNHPNTNFLFSGSIISGFDKIKEYAINSASKLPQFTYLGWDIALTENGPLSIETNSNFGLDHYQSIIGGLREVFDITDPHFYWTNKGKRA